MLTLTQIVVTSKLGNMEHLALKMLTKRLKADEAAAFINLAKELQNEADKDNVDAVLQISVNVNSKVYDGIRRRNPNMCQALRELMKEELMEAENKGRKEEARKAAEAAGKAYKTVDLGDLHFTWPCPASSRITSYFGDREQPVAGASTNHQGIDIGVPTGSNVVAAADGEVIISTYSPAI